MPIKGIISVFAVTFLVVAVCWEDVKPFFLKWFDDEEK